MVSKVSRRNFLKGAAAMTVAAAASTLLAGCSGNGGNTAPAANEIVLGDYRVKVTNAKTTQDSDIATEKITGYITPVVSVSYTGKGSMTLAYRDIFSAELGEAKVSLTNPLQVYNSTVGILMDSEPKFKTTDKDAYNNYVTGKLPFKLKVSFNGKETALFEIYNTGTINVSKL